MASEGERKNLTTMEDEETTNGRIPVAGRTNFEDFESEPVEQSSNHSSGRTVTEEVEIPGPGRSNESSTTRTVEYEETNPTMEDVTNWKQEMYQSFIEENRRQQERANRRREEQGSTPIFTGYTNIDDIDGADEDSDIPVADWRNEETMSESDEGLEATPRRADQVVKQEKNSVFNPAVSTEEVADALGIPVDAAYELLEEAPRPTKKAVGESHIWW